MDPTVTGAILVSLSSVVIAIISLISARSASDRSIKAEEAVRRSVQVRVKALDAGEKIIKNLMNYENNLVSLATIVRMRGAMTQDDMPTLQRAVNGLIEARNCVIENSIYLPDEILELIENTFSSHFEMSKVSVDLFESRIKDTKDLRFRLVTLFRNTYLLKQ